MKLIRMFLGGANRILYSLEGTHQRKPEDLVPQALALAADLPKTNPYWRFYYSINSKEEDIEAEDLISNSFEC
jgi:hypothetical protein